MRIYGEEGRAFLPKIVQCCLNEGRVWAMVGPTHQCETESKYDSECIAALSERRSD